MQTAIELHCHGGRAAVKRIEQTLAAAGAAVVDWQEWVRGHASDSMAADAQIAMAHARTERTAAVLLDQYRGALQQAFEEVERLVASGQADAALAQIELLLTRASIGLHLVRPWRVVLAGRPNVGKSSLVNAILGYERAIVHPAPGTTRDNVTATTAIDGWPVELGDTAGFTSSDSCVATDAVLSRGIQLGRERIAAADLVVLVFDRCLPISAEDERLLADLPGALLVDNKCDLPRATGKRPEVVETSALRGEGIANLLECISHRLVPDPPAPGAAVPFTEEHCVRLRAMAAGLSNSDSPEP
jgi:tRNA modification GTPase